MPSMESSTLLIIQRGIARGFLTLKRDLFGDSHKREGWSLGFGSLFGVLLLLQILIAFLLGLAGAQVLLLNRTDVKLEIRQEATRADAQQFFSALQALPEVTGVTYVTREQAYAQAKEKDAALTTFLDKFGISNPFPDTVNVRLTSLDVFPALTTFLAQPQWSQIINPTYLTESTTQEQDIRSLLSIAHGGQALFLLLLAIAGGVLLLTIIELTRRNALNRREEVLVERLVGAETMTIFLPFATEVTVLLWLGIIVSGGLLVVFLVFLPTMLPALASGGALANFTNVTIPILRIGLPIIFLCEIVASPFLACFGAWLGIRPSIRSTSLHV
ncbi:MAG: permease-like cell division protein FtsX [Candidatus Peregrinibacteria bacterium]